MNDKVRIILLRVVSVLAVPGVLQLVLLEALFEAFYGFAHRWSLNTITRNVRNSLVDNAHAMWNIYRLIWSKGNK